MAKTALELRGLRYAFCSLCVSPGHIRLRMCFILLYFYLPEQKTLDSSIKKKIFKKKIWVEKFYNQSHLPPMYVYQTSFFPHLQSFTSLHFCLIVVTCH